MNRISIIALAVLSLAPAARAEEESSTTPAVDVSALEGRVSSIEEQYAETKSTVAGLTRLKWSGYMQARYAYQQCVGNKPTAGCSYTVLQRDSTGKALAGNPDRDNFFIRRGRIKAVYDADLAQFVLQLDATPAGVGVKEAYASVKLPAFAGVSGAAIDAGLQLFPFGYDVGVRSSADLDLLERYRGAGYYLKGEYDLGVALRAARGPVNLRVGVFNGNGVDGGAGRDNDQLKDLIGRVGFDFGMVTGGVSGWYGNSRDYHLSPAKTYKRERVGADVQVYLDLLPIGGTALKAEYIAGTLGIGGTSDAGADPKKWGRAWHATVTQNLGKTFQLAARYEQFVKDNNIGDAKYAVKEIDELDVAAHAFIGGNYKLSLLYAHPMNGKKVGTKPTTGTGPALLPANDVNKTDQFVVQAQAKF
jgi:hypothetical protein